MENILHDFERAIVLNTDILKASLPICGGGPTMEYRYMCASGLYMTYWTSLMYREVCTKPKQNALFYDDSLRCVRANVISVCLSFNALISLIY